VVAEDGLREDVGGGVPQHVEVVARLVGDDLDLAVLGQGRLLGDEFVVDLPATVSRPRPGPISYATSSTVAPDASSRVEPSGSVTVTVLIQVVLSPGGIHKPVESGRLVSGPHASVGSRRPPPVRTSLAPGSEDYLTEPEFDCMADDPLNNLDRRILHLLQVDARGPATPPSPARPA